METIEEADRLFQSRSFSEAEKSYQSIFLKNPENHRALLGISLSALEQNNLERAIQFMREAANLAPSIALYRRNLGELLRRAGQREAAIASHKIAAFLEPHSPESHFLLGLALNDNRQFEEAIHHYQTALFYDQNYGLAWNNLGASLESIGDKATAKIAYATAIALNPKHIEAQNNLGAIYSEEGRLEEARLHFSAAIAENPFFVDAHYNLSLIKTYTKEDPHLLFLQSISEKMDNFSPDIRIRYLFSLGKALDDIQEYARAFEAYSQGNRLYYQHRPWDKSKLEELAGKMQSVFTQEFLKRPRRTKDARCPIFIVGMPRAGSTLIEQILASHESVYGAGELSILDEIIHEARDATALPFHTWLAQLSDQDFENLGKKYLDRTWKLAPDKNFIIDKMPGNFFYIGMIYRMLPTAKIIHSIRDPMDSCFSCFTHLFKDSMLFSYDLEALGNYYRLYAQIMEHWHKVLPEGVIFDLAYEQMVANHEAISKQLINYIGLPWDSNCLKFYENTRTVKTASLTQVRKPIYKSSVQRWQHFAKELEPLLKIVGPYRNKKGISA